MEIKIFNALLKLPIYSNNNFIKKWKNINNKWIPKEKNPLIWFKDFKTNEIYTYKLGDYPISTPFDYNKIYNCENVKIGKLICESYNFSTKSTIFIPKFNLFKKINK